MIHAILEDLLTPEQAREHLRLIDAHLIGPDGARLFDRPLPYHGGPQRCFQRAESATLLRPRDRAHVHARAPALRPGAGARRRCRALLPCAVPGQRRSASARDRAERDAAPGELLLLELRRGVRRPLRGQRGVRARARSGAIALDGGWRVYSSGAGIALGLIVRHFLGLASEAEAVSIDPVIPPALDGLRVQTALLGRPIEVQYRVRGSGCGVTSIVLNGAAVPFTPRPNPHRRGAALVAHSALSPKLSAKENVLVIELG